MTPQQKAKFDALAEPAELSALREENRKLLAKQVISSHLDTLEAKQVAAALISTSEKLERARKALEIIFQEAPCCMDNPRQITQCGCLRCYSRRALADIGPAEPIRAPESQG